MLVSLSLCVYALWINMYTKSWEQRPSFASSLWKQAHRHFHTAECESGILVIMAQNEIEMGRLNSLPISRSLSPTYTSLCIVLIWICYQNSFISALYQAIWQNCQYPCSSYTCKSTVAHYPVRQNPGNNQFSYLIIRTDTEIDLKFQLSKMPFIIGRFPSLSIALFSLLNQVRAAYKSMEVEWVSSNVRILFHQLE